jgi:hypothetical protein
MKAWCILRKRREVRRDLVVADWDFFLAAGFDVFLCELEEGFALEEGVVESGACAPAVAVHTTAFKKITKRKNLRNPTTSF